MVRVRTKAMARDAGKARGKDMVMPELGRDPAMDRDAGKARGVDTVMPVLGKDPAMARDVVTVIQEARDPGMARAWEKSGDTAGVLVRDHDTVSLTTRELEMPREEEATVLAEVIHRTKWIVVMAKEAVMEATAITTLVPRAVRVENLELVEETLNNT